MIELTHNLEPARFVWLWAKYVVGFNPRHHCTNALRGVYSKRLWKGNPDLPSQPTLLLDERPVGSYRSVYLCGVATAGYRHRANYPHNVHAAIIDAPGQTATWEFEEWRLTARNGTFVAIPSVEDLPTAFRHLPDSYVTCRIFRWAACFFDRDS